MKPEIFEIPIDPLTRPQSVAQIASTIKKHRPLWIATVNSEWLMRARNDPSFRGKLLKADLRLADGGGVLWAAKFLSLRWRGVPWAVWQLLYSGASLIIYPRFCRTVLPDIVPGSWLTQVLAREAAAAGWRLFLLGAAPGVGERVAEKWRAQYPELQIATSSADPNDQTGAEVINQFKPHIILVAYPAGEQLSWLEANLSKLPPAVGIGIGGSLDYLAGAVTQKHEGGWQIFHARRPPRIINYLGLEWLWRLVTQPWRWRRIWTAVPVFMKTVLQYKRQLAVNRTI